jgi:hypothetical protein
VQPATPDFPSALDDLLGRTNESPESLWKVFQRI